MSNRVYVLKVIAAPDFLKEWHGRQYANLAEVRRITEAMQMLWPDAKLQIVSLGAPTAPVRRALRA